MSYLDDLVKLRYLVPMREAANSAIGNINTVRSQDAMKEFLDNMQTNPDGTGRPGGAVGLDLSNPASIQKILGMEGGTLSKLLEISGGKTGTPEMANVQSISDRILQGMNIGSEMTARAGTTKYQEGELTNKNRETAVKEKLAPSEIAEHNAMAGYYNRMPSDTKERQKTTAEIELINGMEEAIIHSENPLIQNYRGNLLDVIRENTTVPFSQIQGMVLEQNPKMPADKRQELAKNLMEGISKEFQTVNEQKIAAQKEIKRSAAIQKLQQDWDNMGMMQKDAITAQAKATSSVPLSDSEAEDQARKTWMMRNLNELGIDNGAIADPNGIMPFVGKTKRRIGTAGTF